MKENNVFKLFVLVFSLSIFLFQTTGISYGADDKTDTNKKNDELKPVVRLQKISRDTARQWVQVSGFIRPVNRYIITSEINGRIAEINYDAGDKVDSGEVIIKIENLQIEALLKKSKAMLDLKLASLKRMEATRKDDAILEKERIKRDLRIAEAEYEKLIKDHNSKKGLIKRGISSNELNSLESACAQALARKEYLKSELEIIIKKFDNEDWKIDIEKCRAEVKISESDLKNATVDHNRLSITSPVKGVVAKRYVEKGQIVNSGTPLVEFLDTTSMQLDIYVAEKHISQIKIGQFAEIFLNSEEKIKGKVSLISPEADREKSGFLVRIKLDETERRLYSGIYASAAILVKEKKNSIFVPRFAIIENENEKIIYQCREDNTVVKKNVETGIEEDERIEIISGIDKNLPVVIEGIHNIRENDEIRIFEDQGDIK